MPAEPMSRPALLRQTEAFLHDQIPLTRAMGMLVERYDETGLVLTAPLQPNHNHLGTAFGGSLATLATLAGYTLLWLELGDRSSHIVIQESRIRYLAPVRGELRAHAPRLAPEALADFRRTYARSGKARIELAIRIPTGGKTGVAFTGTFVALR